MANADPWVDEAIVAPEEWNVDDAVRHELERLVAAYRACTWAKGIPRRLGGGATPAQLRQDKKAMRQMAHVFQYLLNQWTQEESDYELPQDLDDVPQSQRTIGAQMDVLKWMDENCTGVIARGSTNVTMLHRVNLVKKANRWKSRYNYELSNLERIRTKTFEGQA